MRTGTQIFFAIERTKEKLKQAGIDLNCTQIRIGYGFYMRHKNDLFLSTVNPCKPFELCDMNAIITSSNETYNEIIIAVFL
jgi:hypothetical protein